MKTLCLSTFLLMAASSAVFANGGGYMEGVKSTGPFRPVNVDSVEMVSEKLDIALKEDAAVVSITYELHNPGKAMMVEMGFPCSVVTRRTSRGNKSVEAELPVLEDFTLQADGKAVEAKSVKDSAKLHGSEAYEMLGARLITGWQVVQLPFAKEQTRTVTVRYRNPYFRQIFAISSKEDASPPSMRYLFSAAGLWKGPIKSGQVTIRATGVDPSVVRLSHAKRFQREGNQWTWNFSDFEPTLQDDLEIIAGENEFTQRQRGEDGKETGIYVMRGRSPDRAELQKSGKWFFIGRQYTAVASSCLKAGAGFTYVPENLNDDTEDNAWAEGAEGDGIGESLTLTMKHLQKATKVVIQNGYRKNEALFSQNNRVKRMSVSLNGGEPFRVELQDGYRRDTSFAVPPDTGALKTVKMTIEEVYPGTDFHDTCISGVDVEVQLSKAPPIFPSR